MKARIVVLPGDGIGPEVTAEALRVLGEVARRGGHELRFEERLMGGCSIDAHGTALTPEVLRDCQAASAGKLRSQVIRLVSQPGDFEQKLRGRLLSGTQVIIGFCHLETRGNLERNTRWNL